MHFGINLHLVTILKYKNEKLEVVRHSYVNGKYIDVFTKDKYNKIELTEDVEKNSNNLRSNQLYASPTVISSLELKSFHLYTDKKLFKIIKKSQVYFGEYIENIKVKI